jgi:hypothetical protein
MIGHFNSFQVLNATISAFDGKSICQGVIVGNGSLNGIFINSASTKEVIRSKKCLRLCSTKKSSCTHCTSQASYIRQLLKNKSDQKLTGKIKRKTRMQTIERGNRRVMQRNKVFFSFFKNKQSVVIQNFYIFILSNY